MIDLDRLAAPYRVVRTWDDGSTSEIRCMSKATAERVKAERSAKMGLPTRDGLRCVGIEILSA